MKARTIKRLLILIFTMLMMVSVMSIGASSSSTGPSTPIQLKGSGGITPMECLDAEVTPVTIVPESALRYIGDD